MSAALPRQVGNEVAIAGEAVVCDPCGIAYFPDMRLLAVADLHLEKGSSYAIRGSLLPPYDTAATLLALGRAISAYDPRCVVSLGDSFHDDAGAARLPETFRDTINALMRGRDWYWVAGNHDPSPPPGVEGTAVSALSAGALTFRHEPSRGGGDGEVAGHLHPSARIVQRGRSVRRRCFASDGHRLIMPAFGAYTGSLNVLDRAYAGLFRWERFIAYMMGSGRVFAITRPLLKPD